MLCKIIRRRKKKKRKNNNKKVMITFIYMFTHKGKFMSVSGQAEEGKGDMIIGHFVLEGVYYVYG